MASNFRLHRRGKVYYYRRRVPQSLRSVFERDSIMVSLQTSDRREAAALRTRRDLEWDARFAAEAAGLTQPPSSDGIVQSKRPVKLTSEAALQMVLSYVEQTDKRRSERWATNPPTDADQRLDAIENLQDDLAVAHGVAPDYDHYAYFAETWTDIFGPDATVDDPGQAAAVQDLVKRAWIEIERRALARAQDDRGRRFFDWLFDPARPKPVTVRQLADEFIALKTEEGRALGTSEKHLDKLRGNVALVCEIVGDAVLVSEINWDRCRRFLSVLAQVPSNRTKKYKGQTLDEAIEHAALDGNPILSHISQQQYLATFKELLELAVKKDLLRTNYASEFRPLKIDEVAPEDKTVPFDFDQLQSFFQSPFYMTCARADPVPYRAADKDWRFWFPLLSLFSGMRPKEIFQLHAADLKFSDAGTPYLDITATSDDDDDLAPNNKKTLKTATSRRQIPLHPELVKIGFANFVEDQRRASGDERLFQEITRNKYGDPAAYPLRRFREKYLKEGMTLRSRQTAYSFRHTWRDAARMIDATPDFLKAVGAWKGNLTTSDIYGSKHHPDKYAPDLAKIAYPGLDLSHLYFRSER